MRNLLPDQIPDGWNKTSKAYDRDIWALMRPFVRDAVEHARLAPRMRVLDVAAGTGAVTLRAAEHARSVLAVDFADEMLARLRERVATRGLANVETKVMDGQALDLDDACFDAAFSNFGLIFFPDRVRGFRELHRVLRPGGRAVVTAWSVPERFEFLAAFLKAVRVVVPDLARPKTPPPVFSLADPAQLEREMRAGGFEDAEVHTVRHTLEVESAGAYWEMMSTSAPPAVVLLEKIGLENAARVRDTLLRQLGDGPLVFENEAHIGVGVRALECGAPIRTPATARTSA